MGVALLIRGVSDNDLGPSTAHDRDKAADRLGERSCREAPGVRVGGTFRHTGIAVSEEDHLVVANYLGGPVKLLAANLGQALPYPWLVHRGVQDVALLAPRTGDEHGVDALCVVAGDCP